MNGTPWVAARSPQRRRPEASRSERASASLHRAEDRRGAELAAEVDHREHEVHSGFAFFLVSVGDGQPVAQHPGTGADGGDRESVGGCQRFHLVHAKRNPDPAGKAPPRRIRSRRRSRMLPAAGCAGRKGRRGLPGLGERVMAVFIEGFSDTKTRAGILR